MLNTIIKNAALEYVNANYKTTNPAIVGYWITFSNETQVTHSVQVEIDSDEFVTISVLSRLTILDSTVLAA